MILYSMIDSGNCYKPRLLMAKLGLTFTTIEVSSHTGDTRKADFVAKNPNAMVPLLELDDGRRLAESNAILLYLAEGTRFLPADKYERGLAYQWLFFEQYSHEPYVAVARFICRWLPADHARRADLPRLIERGGQALDVMEKHLVDREFLVGDHYTIADIALFAYTHCAADGGFDLTVYPAVCAWLARVQAQPRFVRMQA